STRYGGVAAPTTFPCGRPNDADVAPLSHRPAFAPFTVDLIDRLIKGSGYGFNCCDELNTKKKLYEFKEVVYFLLSFSPALDVIAVGCADGKIHVHNICYDEVVSFSQSTRGAVTALSFRTGKIIKLSDLV
ncbi:U3 small nucleolar RNA-associated protein 21, partial [Tanacetum coccineum]